MSIASTLRDLKRKDEARPGFAGEHLLVAGLGLALLFFASRRGSPIVRSLATTAGTGLLARAAAGRDGVRKIARKV